MNNFYSQNKNSCFFPPGDNPINIVIFLEEALFKFRYQRYAIKPRIFFSESQFILSRYILMYMMSTLLTLRKMTHKNAECKSVQKHLKERIMIFVPKMSEKKHI